jgi:Rrf2 family transcriptional regulator, nitric oxide-sensitive transcriptional repressor
VRFTRYTDYALRVLMYLGAEPGDDLATVKQISRRYGISENHLMKVVHRLGQTGFIHTVRGRQGGMRLAHAPVDINIGAVVRACEDDMRVVECFDPETNTCPIAQVCALPSVLDEALAAFMAVLDRHTLADLMTPKAALWAVLKAAD